MFEGRLPPYEEWIVWDVPGQLRVGGARTRIAIPWAVDERLLPRLEDSTRLGRPGEPRRWTQNPGAGDPPEGVQVNQGCFASGIDSDESRRHQSSIVIVAGIFEWIC